MGRRVWIALFLVFVAVSPVLSWPVLMGLAALGDCRVSEGGASPCVIGGMDMGEPVAALGLFAAWGTIFTLPLALGLAAAWAAAEIGLWVGRRWRR